MAKLKKETIDALSRNPIYTKDIDKVKAYQDSLYAYNANKKLKEHYANLVKNLDFSGEGEKLGGEFLVKQQPFSKYFVRGKDGYWIGEHNNRGQKGAWFNTYVVNKPIQPYILSKDELSEIPSKGIVSENEEVKLPEIYKAKNQKVNLEEPSEHFLDVSEPNGEGTQRIYFDTRKQLEDFQKENPMLKTGSFSRAKINPKVLEVLKNKK